MLSNVCLVCHKLGWCPGGVRVLVMSLFGERRVLEALHHSERNAKHGSDDKGQWEIKVSFVTPAGHSLQGSHCSTTDKTVPVPPITLCETELSACPESSSVLGRLNDHIGKHTKYNTFPCGAHFLVNGQVVPTSKAMFEHLARFAARDDCVELVTVQKVALWSKQCRSELPARVDKYAPHPTDPTLALVAVHIRQSGRNGTCVYLLQHDSIAVCKICTQTWNDTPLRVTLAWSPKGRFMATEMYNFINVYCSEWPFTRCCSFSGKLPWDGAFDSTETRVVFTKDGRVHVRDVCTEDLCLTILPKRDAYAVNAMFHPTDALIAVLMGSCDVHLFTMDQELVRIIGKDIPIPPSCLRWSPCGEFLAIATEHTRVTVFHTSTGEVHKSFTWTNEKKLYIEYLCWHRSGEYLAVLTFNGFVQVWNVDELRRMRCLRSVYEYIAPVAKHVAWDSNDRFVVPIQVSIAHPDAVPEVWMNCQVSELDMIGDT